MSIESVVERDAAADTGAEDFEFETVEKWMKMPGDYELKDKHVTSVGVDSKDNVYAINRGDRPVFVFDRDGNYLRDWGKGVFKHPHGLHVAPDDTLWITDDGDPAVRHFTPEGKLLLEIGTPGKPTPYMSGLPFNRCTHSALSPKGEIYVSDGYSNARVHKYDPNGKLILSWGEPGTDPGQFNIPHNIVCDDAGWVYVADRESSRVQVFDANGRYETQWNNLFRPNSLFMTRGKCPLCFICEAGPMVPTNVNVPGIGHRVTINDTNGRRLGRVGGLFAGLGKNEFAGSHSISVDSRGDIYVAESGWENFLIKRPGTKETQDRFRGIHKLRKKSGPSDASRMTKYYHRRGPGLP